MNMEQDFDEITGAVYRMLHRIHCGKDKLNMDSDLSNVEFFLLLAVSVLLDAQSGKCGYLKCSGKDNGELPKASQNHSAEEGITIGELNRIMETSVSAVSKKVTILEKKGLVTRRTSRTDRRHVYITLTDRGREICQREKEKKYAYLQEMIKRMGRDDMKDLLRLLNRAFDIMEEIEQEEQ